MATEEAVQALRDKLNQLEAQLSQVPQVGAGNTASQAGPITVKVPRERRLRKFAGSRDDHIIEDWIADAEQAIAGQAESDAVDFLLYHLEGAARDEVRLRPAEERANPAAVFKALRDCFCEGLTSTQALRRFFERRQKDRESVRDYSHALMMLLSRVERLDSTAVADKDKLLRDQFLENLRDAQLRRDIKRWVRDHPSKSFQDIREEVQRWLDEDDSAGRRSAGVREVHADSWEREATCDEAKSVATNYSKIVADLVAGQKTLADGLQQQQQALAAQIEAQNRQMQQQQEILAQLMAQVERTKSTGCFGCGNQGHYRRDCPQRTGSHGASSRPSTHRPALNGKAPRQ